MSERRCGGDCCRSFALNKSPAVFAQLYSDAKKYEAQGTADAFERDVIFIAEMVVELPGERDEETLYTCRHFDDVAGLCTVYDQRPAMCRNYPEYDNGAPCLKCDVGCSLKAAATA